MKLSERLDAIASEIELGKTMADIGTDHGFLPIYMLEAGICPKAIATDISPKSLNKAEIQWKNGKYDGEFITRVGNGLGVLNFGEVDTIVIAGMGGLLISDILSDDFNHTKSFNQFILQPRSHTGELRKRLWCMGFEVEKDLLVREGKFIPEILVAKYKGLNNFTNNKLSSYLGKNVEIKDILITEGKKGVNEISDEFDIFFEFPIALVNNPNKYTREFLSRKLDKENKIINKIYRDTTNYSEVERHQKMRSRIQILINHLDNEALQ